MMLVKSTVLAMVEKMPEHFSASEVIREIISLEEEESKHKRQNSRSVVKYSTPKNSELQEAMKLSEPAFNEWDNEEDEIYNTL